MKRLQYAMSNKPQAKQAALAYRLLLIAYRAFLPFRGSARHLLHFAFQ
jgi:hypothetical protein